MKYCSGDFQLELYAKIHKLTFCVFLLEIMVGLPGLYNCNKCIPLQMKVYIMECELRIMSRKMFITLGKLHSSLPE